MSITRRGFVTGVATSGVWLGCQRTRRTSSTREVEHVITAQASRDGAGVALRRSLGTRVLPMLDPFLLLDEIRSSDPNDYTAGFPQHPHRGFETVSYVLRGGFAHRDSVGNQGLIADGGTQWMTAGRGILHEEMPRQTSGPELWGLQLWVNLPAARKMIKPRYQDLAPSTIPELDIADARVRVVAGTVGSARGPVDGIDIRPTLLDATLEPRATFRHGLPGGDTAFAYVLDGEVTIGSTPVGAGQLAVLGLGDTVVASSAGGGRFLLVSGAPIREPVARRGPFVMTTDEELRQAFEDYRAGTLAL